MFEQSVIRCCSIFIDNQVACEENASDRGYHSDRSPDDRSSSSKPPRSKANYVHSKARTAKRRLSNKLDEGTVSGVLLCS